MNTTPKVCPVCGRRHTYNAKRCTGCHHRYHRLGYDSPPITKGGNVPVCDAQLCASPAPTLYTVRYGCSHDTLRLCPVCAGLLGGVGVVILDQVAAVAG